MFYVLQIFFPPSTNVGKELFMCCLFLLVAANHCKCSTIQ